MASYLVQRRSRSSGKATIPRLHVCRACCLRITNSIPACAAINGVICTVDALAIKCCGYDCRVAGVSCVSSAYHQFCMYVCRHNWSHNYYRGACNHVPGL